MLTSEGSHVAVARGVAGKQLIEAGGAIPAGVPVGSWMKPTAKPAEPVEPKAKKAK